MSNTPQLYGHSLALLTDLYQLTMAYGYWRSGMAQREAVFHLFFRTHPFGGQFAVASGLGPVIEFLQELSFTEDDLNYLAELKGLDDKALFDPAFLKSLRDWRFDCDVDAVPEGTAVFAHEPLLRVRGPILQCQILETPFLTMINFHTLVATKAARVCQAADGDPVLEFGLRRAQGVDGGLSASRAAIVGGCSATSNVLAGRMWDVPVRGTHAHSWVMAFDDELEAFQAYAEAMPNNCLFLIDTYDTIEGVRRAIEVGRQLQARGHQLGGVRLDSGDLVQLSTQARILLDEAGFPDAAIVASNDLDEFEIDKLKRGGAKIDTWGVGTRLATAYQQPALGGVYKLSAIRAPDGKWQYKMKVSQQRIKVSNPGIQQVRRYERNGRFVGDIIHDSQSESVLDKAAMSIDIESSQPHRYDEATRFEPLLVPVFRQGRTVYNAPTVLQSQQRTRQQLDRLPGEVIRLREPVRYPVGLGQGLHRLKEELICETTG